MRRTTRWVCILAALLLLTGCASPRHAEQTTAETTISGTSAPETSLAVTDTETATTATSEPPTSAATEQPALPPLPDGMLIYSEDFDDYADSSKITALNWSEYGSYAPMTILNHKLYFKNTPEEGKKPSDSGRLLGEALPEFLAEYPFTVQYDIEYLGGTAGACAGMISPKDAVGLPTAEIDNTPITVRLCWEPEVGFTVLQRRAGETSFVKTGDPIPGASGKVFLHVGAADGYLDNIRIWIGHGENPDANVLCYWQWQILNAPETEGGSK